MSKKSALSEQKIYFDLVLVGRTGNVLCKGGSYDSEDAAKDAVNSQMECLPHATAWMVIKVTKEVVAEGHGSLPRQTAPAPSDRGRWW